MFYQKVQILVQVVFEPPSWTLTRLRLILVTLTYIQANTDVGDILIWTKKLRKRFSAESYVAQLQIGLMST